MTHSVKDFHLSAPVLTADGRLLGHLHRVIVERESFDPRAIVVKEDPGFGGHRLAAGSWLLTDDLVVPIDAVAGTDRQRVELILTAAQARRLPPYLTYRHRPTTRVESLEEDLSLIGGVAVPPLVESASKRPDEIEIEAGENVMLGRTGRRLGHVRDVLFESGELVGIVLRPSGFFKQDVLLPVRFLTRGDDLALFAELTPEDLRHLEPFQPEG